MSSQLELFSNGPFTVRLDVELAFRIFIETYWKHLPSSLTTRKHIYRICQYFRGRTIETISPHDLENFRRHLLSIHLSQPSVNKHLMVFGRCISKLIEYKEAGQINGEDCRRWVLPEKNPAHLVHKVNERQFARKKVIQKHEIRRLAIYADEFCKDQDLRDIIYGFYWTRLRESDLRRITSDSVNFKKSTIEGIQHKTITFRNPSGVPFVVVMEKELSNLIFRRVRQVKPGTPLFNFKNINKRWKRLLALAEMPGIQRRDFRRSAASHLLDSGIDPQTVAESLGHTTLRMLPTYTPRTLDHLKKAAEELVK